MDGTALLSYEDDDFDDDVDDFEDDWDDDE